MNGRRPIFKSAAAGQKGGDYEKAINPTNHGSGKITKCLFILLAR